MTNQLVKDSTENLVAAGEYELLDLLQLINDELTEGLRVQNDAPPPAQENNDLKDIGRHICVELDEKLLAIPLPAVLEAGDLQSLQSLPLLQDWLSGITNIRGEIVSVVNLALFLGRTNKSPMNTRPFLVVHDDTIKVVITVDRIVAIRVLYIPCKEESAQHAEINPPTDFFAGRAIYKGKDGEQGIDLFDLKAFLRSQKLRDVATV